MGEQGSSPATRPRRPGSSTRNRRPTGLPPPILRRFRSPFSPTPRRPRFHRPFQPTRAARPTASGHDSCGRVGLRLGAGIADVMSSRWCRGVPAGEPFRSPETCLASLGRERACVSSFPEASLRGCRTSWTSPSTASPFGCGCGPPRTRTAGRWCSCRRREDGRGLGRHRFVTPRVENGLRAQPVPRARPQSLAGPVLDPGDGGRRDRPAESARRPAGRRGRSLPGRPRGDRDRGRAPGAGAPARAGRRRRASRSSGNGAAQTSRRPVVRLAGGRAGAAGDRRSRPAVGTSSQASRHPRW